jgi:hypothetical protein
MISSPLAKSASHSRRQVVLENDDGVASAAGQFIKAWTKSKDKRVQDRPDVTERTQR